MEKTRERLWWKLKSRFYPSDKGIIFKLAFIFILFWEGDIIDVYLGNISSGDSMKYVQEKRRGKVHRPIRRLTFDPQIFWEYWSYEWQIVQVTDGRNLKYGRKKMWNEKRWARKRGPMWRFVQRDRMEENQERVMIQKSRKERNQNLLLGYSKDKAVC